MRKISEIIETQYDSFVDGDDLGTKSIIDETMHYPKFLGGVNMELTCKVNRQISFMAKNRIFEMNGIYMNIDYKRYFDVLIFDISLYEDEDINDEYKYTAYAISDETLVDGKLKGGRMAITAPINSEKKTSYSKIESVIRHEATRLYDDWDDLRLGGTGIFSNLRNIEDTNFFNDTENSQNNAIKVLRWLAYLSIHTEQNTYTQQIMQELKSLKATHADIKERYKETASYNDLKKTETEFYQMLNNTNYDELPYANEQIIEKYSDTAIPKMNPEQFDVERYYDMIKKYGERVLHNRSKKFFRIVQSHRDELAEKYYKNNCIIVHE